MDGDLNLSQALGGLRIANQTGDSPPPSPGPSSTYASRNNDDESSQSQIYIPDLQSLETNALHGSPPSTGAPGGGGVGGGASGDDIQQQQHSMSFHSQSNTPLQQQNNFGPSQSRATYLPPPAPSSRHSAQFMPNYNGTASPFPPSTPGGSAANQLYSPEYTRISREPSRSSLSGPPGSSSSGPRPAARDRSNTDRTYRQSNAAGPSPFREECGATGGSAGTRYDAEHGIPASSAEWQEKGAAVAIKKELDANGNVVTRVVKKGVKDFNFGRTLGEGSYSTVSAPCSSLARSPWVRPLG